MVEWLALVISVIALLLEKEKISQLFSDFSSWKSQRKYKREGELFAKRIASTSNKDGLRTVFSMFFFFFLLSSGLSGLLKVETIERISAVGALTLSPLLLLSLRGLVRQFKEYQASWLLIIFMGFLFLMTFAGLGLLWGMITVGFLYFNLPVFWAGFAATPCTIALLWLLQYIAKKTWAKDMDSVTK